MKKFEGNHFYINIKNLNEIILHEEQSRNNVTHCIHAIDTFFSSIEWYGKSKYPDEFVVEKITGSRLHLYILSDLNRSIKIMFEISKYAFELIEFMNSKISKYKTLVKPQIQIGTAYGQFKIFLFNHETYEEETSIGFVANYAAKLCNFAHDNCICVSSEIYNQLPLESKIIFSKKENNKIHKYGETHYYETKICNINANVDFSNELEYAQNFANSTYLKEINYSGVEKRIHFPYLSKTNCKKLLGIPFFADVRGFTSKFENDDSNLDEMANETRNILTTMYTATSEKGVHVQFQGDREFALFHNTKDYNCSVDAVFTGMKLIDHLSKYKVSIGIGQSFGNMYASRIGARGEKDNIVLGKTVSTADFYEDEYANENQIVIDKEIYITLLREHPILAKQFSKLNDNCYYTTIGHKAFCEKVQYERMIKNTKNNNYNGAWGQV